MRAKIAGMEALQLDEFDKVASLRWSAATDYLMERGRRAATAGRHS